MKRLILFLFLLPSLFTAPAFGQSLSTNANQDSSSREFVMSCTYGVLAGTLVGAASLAFTKRPGENLNRVARGASLGLYSGILLGLYVVYIVPGLDQESDEDPVAMQKRIDKVSFMLSPTLKDSVVDGVRADWTLLRF